MQLFDGAFAQTKCYQHIFICILLDIDDFKATNDTHGHLAGGLVIKEIPRQISGQIREADAFQRYGGEEFLIVLPNTNAEEARQVAEKISITVEETTIGEH